MTAIALPEEIAGLSLVASVSGGKDSTALMLALREAGLPFRAVFADTQWEAPETYAYLDVLREKIGPIDVVGVDGGMVARARHSARWPTRMQRWCTRELKIEPLRKYHDAIEATGVETVSVLGIRADESASRAKMLALEDEPAGQRRWGGWIWRPLLTWTIADVLEIHNRHGVPVNPLYQRGHDRVGCYPCIFSNKDQIKLLADTAPERIDLIRDLEVEMSATRAERNAEKPGRYTHEAATFFQTRMGVDPMGIDAIVGWSRTDRGGRQLPLLAEPPSGGCMRWGICDLPAVQP